VGARVCVCVRQKEKDPSLMIFFANDEVPQAILSFESVYQRHAEAKEVQRGVIIFSLKERVLCTDVIIKKREKELCIDCFHRQKAPSKGQAARFFVSFVPLMHLYLFH
jgi:hypothetical protein